MKEIDRILRQPKDLPSSSSNNITAIPSGEISINYVSMLQMVSETFVSTVISAGALNAGTIEKGWHSMVVVAAVAVAIVCLMFVGNYLDAIELKEHEVLKKADQSAVMKLAKHGALFSSFRNINHIHSEKSSSKHGEVDSTPTSFLKVAEEALPQVLSSRSYFSKYKDELKRHHRWVGVFFHFTKKFPRALRVLALATNIITMLFIQSITYNLTNGDDGSCERLHDEASCLDETSGFSTGSSKCYWIRPEMHDGAGTCKFVQPDSDLTVIIFVAIFSAIVSTPIAITIDWLIQHVLSAPVLSAPIAKKIVIASLLDSENLTSVAPRQRRNINIKLQDMANSDELAMKRIQTEYNHLQEHLKMYRATLPSTLEFDGKL
jgi:hypothetical protein